MQCIGHLTGFLSILHIYGGDFFNTPRSDWDPETLQERPYDVARARRLVADANERWLAECATAAAAGHEVRPAGLA